jgi:hypothetical protein
MQIKVVGTIVVPSSESGFMERTEPPTDGAERPKDTSAARSPEHVLRPEHHRTGWYRYRSGAARSCDVGAIEADVRCISVVVTPRVNRTRSLRRPMTCETES